MKFDIDFIRSLWRTAEALYYLGFNVTAIKDYKKAPYHVWKHFRWKEQSVWEAVDHKWFQMTGVGAVTGIKSLFCLDFDKCDLSHLPSFLQMLELPQDYNWVVVSGSGRGFHIWFSSDSLQKLLPQIGTTVLVYTPKKLGHFNQIELRLNCHVVMPPSKSATGGQYHFLNPNDLKTRPKEIDYEKTVKLFVEEVGTLKTEEPKQAELFDDGARSQRSRENTKSSYPAINDLETFNLAQWYAEELNARRIDITRNYRDWLRIAFGFANSFNEAGRSLFHLVSSAGYPTYKREECEQFYSDALTQNKRRDSNKKRVTVATFFKMAHDAGIKRNSNGNK